MWLPAFGLVLGILVGLVTTLSVPVEYARYTAIALLAAMDSVLGAARAHLDGEYDGRVFISGLVVNSALAVVLTFVGDRLGVELYLAAIVAFGVRLFSNIGSIRRQWILRRGRT